MTSLIKLIMASSYLLGLIAFGYSLFALLMASLEKLSKKQNRRFTFKQGLIAFGLALCLIFVPSIVFSTIGSIPDHQLVALEAPQTN